MDSKWRLRVRTLELGAGNVGLTPRHLLTTPHSPPKSPSSKIRPVCQYTLEYKSIEYDTSPKHYQPAWRNKCLHLAKHDSFKNTIIVIRSWHPVPSVQVSSVAQSCPTLWPHEMQHARPPCPAPTPGVHPNSCPLSWWCHPAISSSVVPFTSWQTDGETVETVSDFILGGLQNHCRWWLQPWN